MVSDGMAVQGAILSGGNGGWHDGSWSLAVAVQWFLAVGRCCCVGDR